MSLLSNAMAIPPAGAGGYTLTDSIRFRSSASAYLTRSPSVTGTNRKKYTISMWVKRSDLNPSQPQALMVARTGTTSLWDMFRIDNSDDTLELWYYNGASYSIKTAAKFNDPSAWYHFICAVDTTQATAANRVKMYVNGAEQTLTGSYPPQNSDMYMNHTYDLYIGQQASAYYFDGYMTEINFVDGQTLTETDFGEYDDNTGVWKPKEYTGTYGTNGFYLPMSETNYIDAEYLVVAGGGGAGGVSSDASGGGGGGGLLTSTSYLATGSTYTVTVGAGGAGTTLTRGSAGGTSSLVGTGVNISTTGGGGGGYATGSGSGASSTGGSGGSGGGGGNPTASSGGTGIAGQGYAGGNTYGGGGGAGGAGSTSTFSNTGNAGIGVLSSITGASLGYAGGGNGGGSLGSNSYGSGKGEYDFATGTNTAGTANTGGGGGGRWHSGTVSGASGGSGVVILKVLTSDYTGTTTGSPTVTTSGSYTIMKFTSSGSYTA